MAKFVTANEAAELIDNGSTIAIGGFGSYCGPDALLEALEQRFLKTGKPVNLTTFTGVSNGAFELADVGMNRICHEGLIGTIIAGHLGNAPKLSAIATLGSSNALT